jgi:single-stranded DNA-binding protein
MSARGIVNGVLSRDPAQKTSKAGKPYVIATIRDGKGDAVRWWKVFIFGESLIEEIMRLGDGEPIAVAGEFDCEVYAPASGESRLSWRITADAVLSARPKPKADKASRASQPRPSGAGQDVAAASWASPNRGGALDDDLPF